MTRTNKCAAKTQTGKKCTRLTKTPRSKYCWQHKQKGGAASYRRQSQRTGRMYSRGPPPKPSPYEHWNKMRENLDLTRQAKQVKLETERYYREKEKEQGQQAKEKYGQNKLKPRGVIQHREKRYDPHNGVKESVSQRVPSRATTGCKTNRDCFGALSHCCGPETDAPGYCRIDNSQCYKAGMGLERRPFEETIDNPEWEMRKKALMSRPDFERETSEKISRGIDRTKLARRTRDCPLPNYWHKGKCVSDPLVKLCDFTGWSPEINVLRTFVDYARDKNQITNHHYNLLLGWIDKLTKIRFDLSQEIAVDLCQHFRNPIYSELYKAFGFSFNDLVGKYNFTAQEYRILGEIVESFASELKGNPGTSTPKRSRLAAQSYIPQPPPT